MFKEISQVQRNRSEFKRRALCFLFSLVFHTGFLYLLLSHEFTYKIFPEKDYIREVVIVPPEEIFVPEDIDQFIQNTPYADLPIKDRFLDAERRFKGGFTAEENTASNRLSTDEAGGRTDFMAIPAETLSRFELNLPSQIKLDSPEKYNLDLSQDSKMTENLLKEIKKGYKTTNLRLPKSLPSRYLYPSSSSTRLAKNLVSGRYRPGIPVRKGMTSFNLEDYNITSWAEAVVNRIQKNWNLFPSQQTGAKGVVRVFVVIERDGELSSVEIVDTSEIPVLEEAALKAINLSAPFPMLPQDFPGENLEVYFLFQYDN